MRLSGRPAEIICAAACCLLALGCILLAHPFANAAFNDDWSYSRTALEFARTGRIVYNGWGSPMILFQTLWAGPWIQLFGFSFDLLRVVTLPFSMGSILLAYALGRRAGLVRERAIFAAIAFGTSPLFLPSAASFMSDPYACFLVLLSLYAALRSAEAPTLRGAAVWLWAVALAGFAAGSVRQIAWAAPLALIPSLAWRRNKDRVFVWHSSAAFAGCCIGILLLVRAFRPPYSPTELPYWTLVSTLWRDPGRFPAVLISLGLSAALFACPAVICSVNWKRLSANAIAIALIAGAAVMAVAALMSGGAGVAPYLGNTVTRVGVLSAGRDAMGVRPGVLPMPVWFLISLAVPFCLAVAFMQPRVTRTPRAQGDLFASLCLAYLALMSPAIIKGLVYDRYLLPILPIVIITALRQGQARGARIPVAAWGLLFIFGWFGCATTHDYYAALRARVAARQSLIAAGVPSDRISAGFELDGWQQLETTDRIRGFKLGDMDSEPRSNAFWFWRYATSITPDHVVFYAGNPESAEVVIPVQSWLPARRWYVLGRKGGPMSGAGDRVASPSVVAERASR